MISTRPLLLIGVSALVGLAAVFAAVQWIARQASVPTAKAVVAATDLDLGTRLSAEMLQVVDWPSGAMMKGTISDPKVLEGRVINTSVLRSEPIVESELAPVGTTGGLSAVIAKGTRAMTVKVNEVMGVAGFALPGNYVDIMVSAQDDDNKFVSKFVLQQILVLAVAQEVTRQETKPKVVNAVTLEVTPEQAERLDLARNIGNLSLVLRNPIDTTPAVTAGVRKAELLGLPAAPTRQQPAFPAEARVERIDARGQEQRPVKTGARAKIEVIRGVKRSSVDF